MHHMHSWEHSVSPRSFATKSSNYCLNAVRGGEHQHHSLTHNFVWGFRQDKTECKTCTTQCNSRPKGGLFCNLCWPFGNCKQGQHILLFHHCWRWNTAPTVWPASKKMKRSVEGHKLTCLKQTSCTAFKNKNNDDCFFQVQRCSAQGICSTESNRKPRCLQRCIALFMWQHSISSP